jgi:NADPH2:quinone reductase
VIAAVGAGVDRLKPGMRVMGFAEMGGYAQRAVLAQSNCFVIPASMSSVDAAAMGIAYQTAHIALMDRGQYRTGEIVLVNGASGAVGGAAVQVAKAKGALVLAGLTTPGKADALAGSGADHVIDLSRADLAKSLREQIFAVTGGRGVDVVLDPIGGDVFDASLRALAWRGRAVIIGFVADRVPTIKANYLLIKNISVSGMYWGSYGAQTPDEIRAVQEDLFALYTTGKIKPAVMEVLPLQKVKQAFDRLSRREVTGRIVLAPAE